MWIELRNTVAVTPFFVALFFSHGAQGQTLSDRLSKANPVQGESVFAGCQGCHSIEEGGPTLLGPNLWNVIKRPVASVEGYDYSDAMKEFGGTWTLERLDSFLLDPAGTVPGTRMAVPGITDDKDRSNLIAYMNQFSANPLPIGLDPELAKAEADASEAGKKRDFGLFVDAPGVDKTYALCTPCHSEMIIVQQGKTRKRWDTALDWMIEEQGMAPLSDADRKVILDYLSEHYNEDRPNFPKR